MNLAAAGAGSRQFLLETKEGAREQRGERREAERSRAAGESSSKFPRVPSSAPTLCDSATSRRWPPRSRTARLGLSETSLTQRPW